MIGYLVRRLAIAIVVIVIVGAITQLTIHFVPGNPAVLVLGVDSNPNPEQVKALEHKLGLDKPLYLQVFSGVMGYFRFDLGKSLRNSRSVSKMFIDKFPVSASLVLGSTVVMILFGLPLGILAAAFHNSPVDWFVRVYATIGMSVPVFVSGSLLIYIFCWSLDLIPAVGYTSLTSNPLGFLRQLTLPALASGVYSGGVIARMTRSSFLEKIQDDYVRTARSKGLKENRVLVKHALRNAIIPVVSLLGVQFGTMFGNTVLVETVFNWPGMMSAVVAAARFNDFPVVRGFVMMIATILVFVNLGTDILYAIIDPRIVYD